MTAEARYDDQAKLISELDTIVQAMLATVPQLKLWQRQLRVYLIQLEREVQVLRMTVVMARPEVEVREAAAIVSGTLRAADAYVAAGRADMGTKAAVRLALELGQKINRALIA